MMKRATGWVAAVAVLLCLPWGARVTFRHARRLFNRPILAAARENPDGPATSLTIPPRDPNFLLPQRLDAWQIIGPGGGGTFYSPAISPHDSSLVFASTDMTSCFVSENGGHTWRAFNLRGTCRFAFDPKLPNRVYAMAGPLWRSDDRGHTWTTVYPGPQTIVGYGADEGEVWMYGPVPEDEGETWAHARKYYPQGIEAMAVDPDDSNTIYGSMDGNLQMTHDGGKHWKVMTWDDHANSVWVDPTSPKGKRILYLRRENAIYTWDGATLSKRQVMSGVRVNESAFGIRSDGKPVIYLACEYADKDGQPYGGVVASEDGGATWRSLNENLLKLTLPNKLPVFTAMTVSANHAEVVYLGFARLVPPSDKTQYYYGVLKSPDGGRNWTPVRIEASTPAPNMHNDWTTQRFGPDWAEGPVSMTADANNPDLVYTGDLGRLMRSVDGGKNWYGVFSQSTGKGYATTGLDDTTCYGIHIDPFDPKHMFISYTDIGLMSSEDGGESWVSATTNGVPFGMRGNSFWLEFDPAVKGKIWTIQSNRHDLPRHRMLNLYGGGTAAVLVSVDGGHSWKISNHGLPTAMAPTHILLDPKSPVDARVLYVTLFGLGIYKSTDGGQNWERKNEGLPDTPLTWRMALGGDGALYAVTIRRSEDGKYGNDRDGWLFRSRDGANSWQRVTLPEGLNGPMGIMVDPKDPQRLYLAAWARYIAGAAGAPPDGGVFLSANGGQHWENVLDASRRIYDVTVDPRDSNLVYATGFESSAWRSADRGKTWARIGGFNFKDGHRIIPDPTDINRIYITTFGNSVWHGPATGDPNAVEDIVAPPAMRYQTWKQPPEKMY